METQDILKKNKKVVLSSTLVMAIVLAASSACLYYFYVTTKLQTVTMYVPLEKINKARASFYNKDHAGAQAQLENLLRIPMSKTQEASTKVLYSSTLFSSPKEEDKIKGAEMIKNIIKDPEMPPKAKMFAYTTIANFFVKKIGTKEEYLRYFNEAPFNSALLSTSTQVIRGVNGPLSDTYASMLLLSDGVYPNSYAEYMLAGDYYAPIISKQAFSTSSSDVTQDKKLKEIALLAQEYVAKGDTRKDGALFASSSVLLSKLNKAIALTSSNRVLGNLSQSTIENAYKDAYDSALIEKESTVALQSVTFRIRFFYAKFLVENFPERKKDIQDLLLPFGTLSTETNELSNDVRAFFIGSIKNPTSSVSVYSKKLAPYSPEFKKFLVNVGYSF